MGLSAITPHVSIWNIQSQPSNAQVANPDAFNALPADVQQQFRDVMTRIADQQVLASVYYDQMILTAQFREEYESYTIPDPAEIQKAIELTLPVFDKYEEVSGPIGAEILAITDEYASGGRPR